MSTIITAAILITITTTLTLVFIYLNKRNTRKRNEENLKLFSLEGLHQGLSFPKPEILKSKIIGLDHLHRVVLIY
jgi:hypothetical protein